MTTQAPHPPAATPGPTAAPGPATTLTPKVRDGQAFKVIGCGGVGQALARFLAMYLASLDVRLRLVLIDGDEFELSNRARMLFTGCGNKAQVTHAELAPRFAGTALSIVPVPQFVTPDNIGQLIVEGDVVLVTVDNFKTRHLINQHAATLDTIALISGGNDPIGADAGGQMRQGVAGNVQIHVRRGGRDLGPDLAKYHREIADPKDTAPYEAGCTQEMLSLPQILVANVWTTAAIFSTLFLYLCDCDGEQQPLSYCEMVFDLLKARMAPLPLPAPKLTDQPV